MLACAALWPPAVGRATNGTNFIAFSAEAAGLGGADSVAVPDTTALNNNPAALSLLNGGRFDFTPVYIKPLTRYRDAANDREGENSPYIAGNLGYAHRLNKHLVIGAGFFSQGGFGTDYRNITTAFGTQDEMGSFLRYEKLSVGASYEFDPMPFGRLSLGVAPHLGYSDLAIRLFPRTSIPPIPGVVPNGFPGFEIKDTCARAAGLGQVNGNCPHAWTGGVKVGAMLKSREDIGRDHQPVWAVGVAYTSAATMNYTGGKIDFNQTAFGLGTTTYDAKVQGFKWPDQVDVGFAFRPTERLLLSMDVSWIHWSLLKTINIHASNPNNPLAPGTIDVPFVFNWKDQVTLAVGTAYDVTRDVTLRVGYNYSNNPIPSQNLLPIAPLIIVHRFSGGFGWRITDHVVWDASVVYGLKNSQNFTNPNAPFTGAAQSTEGYFVYNTVSYRF